MLRKTLKHPTILAYAMVALLSVNAAAQQPATAVAPATLNRMFTEAETAFGEKEYDKAVEKIQELLELLGNNKNAPLELLYFNIGLGYLLGEKYAEAEAAFTECLKRFPKGEYASRAYLGIGRACVLQDTEEKKLRAIDALRIAAQDAKYRSEAGYWLGQVYSDLGRHDEAMAVFKSLMGSDIRSPQQTTAAVEVIGLLADTGKLEDLIPYLDRLINQAGVRDAIAWYTNQVIVRGDEMVASEEYDSALALYRSIPPRSQIIATQKTALESQKRDIKILEARILADQKKPLEQRSAVASELLNSLKPAVELAEQALKIIEDKTDLDAALLMRRGRCLFYLDRHEEALVCFRAIRTKYPTAEDAQPAAYAEIVILNKLQAIDEIKVLCDNFLRKYPDSPNAEQVGTLAGDVLVQSGDWSQVASFYRNLERQFPESENIDRYTFFQGLALFQNADFKQSTPLFAKMLKNHPNSLLVENALYYVAMSYFLSNDYKNTLQSIKAYLSDYPEGRYAGDLRYRLAFIDSNDKEVDQTDKIIKDLTTFLNDNPDDLSAGSMLCLLGDTYKKKQSNKVDEIARFQKQALEAYKKAVWTSSPDDVIQYALDSATTLLQANKEWAAIAALHSEFLQRNPESPLALMSATWIAKMKAREGKGAEAAEMLAGALRNRIGNPASEQVEFLIDELVKTLVPPRTKPSDIDIDALDAQLIEVMTKAIGEQENATTNARLYFARARLAQLLRRTDKSDLYLRGIATINAKDPSVLSPALLAESGDILLKLGQLDEAEAMFQRLIDRYKEGMFADAGPVGLGYVALARKKPEEAYRIFEDAMENNPGMSRIKETTLGKLEAMVEMGQLDEAEKFALEIAGDRSFRGESVGKAYLLLGKVYRKQSEKKDGVEERLELLKAAYATYQRVYIAYKSFPEVCAEAYYQAYETALELGDQTLADETLKTLQNEPKLQNTAAAKRAASK
jgi:tetratricopeptide (TPR) repeat protein